MKIAIVGAGAIGSYLGAKLSLAGQDVFLIARGQQLQALQRDGVTIRDDYGETRTRPVATDSYSEVGPVDYVFLTVKAYSLSEIAPQISPMLGKDTAVVSAQNGIPWWYFYRHVGLWEDKKLHTLDPNGDIRRAIDPKRIIGCIVYPSTYLAEPGVVVHVEGNRFAIGELNGDTTDRCRQLSRVLIASGLKSPIRSRIRDDMWAKLIGNVAFNPISAVTKSTLSEITSDPLTRKLSLDLMTEAESVAIKFGIKIPVSVEQRLIGASKVGDHKTSMLQDMENEKPLELDALLGSIIELGEIGGVETPLINALFACTKLLERSYKAR
ncbi:uncharacterized protein METZ01_LOCUS182177 [marine metagenome]|uniref:Ketopantoate reductase N-terminal domain-containing protein n=1 Tax=marine metagenome TaxID=408172 RepID=A0A382CVJ8_9ZZZZ